MAVQLEAATSSSLNRAAVEVVVSVPGGPNKPYSYRGIPYQRVGDTTVEMAGGEYQRILVERLHAQTRWENQTADGWSAADLDHGQIVLTVEEAIRRVWTIGSFTDTPSSSFASAAGS